MNRIYVKFLYLSSGCKYIGYCDHETINGCYKVHWYTNGSVERFSFKTIDSIKEGNIYEADSFFGKWSIQEITEEQAILESEEDLLKRVK